MILSRPGRHGLLLLVLLLSTLPFPLSAQVDPPTRLWLGMGPAQGVSAEVDGGLGAMVQLTYQKGPTHLALRGLGLVDFSGFPDGGSDDGMGELGLLWGRTRTASWGHAAVAAGFSWVRLDGCGEGAPEVCNAVGVPFTAEAALQTAVAGIGLQAYGNLNTRTPYGGLVLFLQLGWMP